MHAVLANWCILPRPHWQIGTILAYLIMEEVICGLQKACWHHVIGAQAALCERLTGQNVARQVSQCVAVIQVCCKSDHT